MFRPFSLLAGLAVCAVTATAADRVIHSFKKLHLTREFWAEGAYFADFNKDGKQDVVYGPYWWAGPDFRNRHEFSPATNTFKLKQSDGTEKTIPGFEGALGVNNGYSRNFLTYTGDFNGDSWPDVLVLGFPGEESTWFENPRGKEGFWTPHIALAVTDNESPTFADINGDGQGEIVCCSQGYIGYATYDVKQPNQPFTFHRITPKGEWQRFSHGLGYGDINGDGRIDLLDKDAWWEQPASVAGDPVWTRHAAKFGPEGPAQILVYDVNGDKRNDVITCLNAHQYGLVWYEQVTENGQIAFKDHVFVNKEARENKYGVHFSQPHALTLADMNGDGILDLVTGKRFWAHGPQGDSEPNAAAVLYWFQIVRGPGGAVDFVPHLIDSDSGVGTQVAAADINGDKRPDVVVGNKKGCFVFLHEAKKVSKAEWEAAQPKPYTEIK